MAGPPFPVPDAGQSEMQFIIANPGVITDALTWINNLAKAKMLLIGNASARSSPQLINTDGNGVNFVFPFKAAQVIAAPAGGTTIDAQSRAAIALLIQLLQANGFLG